MSQNEMMNETQRKFKELIENNINQIYIHPLVQEKLNEYFANRKANGFFSLFQSKDSLDLMEGYLGKICPVGQLLLETDKDNFFLGDYVYADIQDDITAVNRLMNELDVFLQFDNEAEAIYVTWMLIRHFIITHVAKDFERQEYDRYKNQMTVQEFVNRVCESNVKNFSAEDKQEFMFSFAAFIMYLEGNSANNPYGIFSYMDRVVKSMPDLYYDPEIEKRKKSDKYSNSGVYNLKAIMKKIDKMEPVTFEKFIGELYENMGYQVEFTPTTGDQGIDVIASKEHERIGIQVKRYSKNVANSAVQEVLAGRVFYKLSKGIVVTNSSFTKSAQELATAIGIQLIDREALIELIKEYM